MNTEALGSAAIILAAQTIQVFDLSQVPSTFSLGHLMFGREYFGLHHTLNTNRFRSFHLD